jgi:hypothetical protein
VTESKETRVDRAWRCECGGDHFLSLVWWPSDVSQADFRGYFHLGGDFGSRLKDRVKLAVKLLRRGHADTYVGVVLTPAQAREVISELQRFVDAAEGTSETH